MVNKQLVDYIKNTESKGYSPQQLHDYLIQRGYDPIEVREAIGFVNKSKTSILTNKKFISIGIFFVIIIIACVASFYFLTGPSDSDFDNDNENLDTKELDIAEPICSIDSDCDDNNVNTLDRCINPSEKTSKCLNAQQTQLSDVEKEISINQDAPILFKVNDENHLIEVEEVTDNSATIAIYSEPKKITLNIGESKEIDVDNDGLNDLYVKLLRITDGKPIFEIKSLEKANKLTLEINPSKDTFKVGEDVSGRYKIEYSDGPFIAIVFCNYSREGIDKNIESIMFKGDINTVKLSFYAFNLDEKGHHIGGNSYFADEGKYFYEVSVYSCNTIESTLGVDCSVRMDKRELRKINPVKTVTKAINVKGRVNIPECKTNDGCTKTCVGCKQGTQLCEWIIERCIDCSTDWDCKSNYKCINKSCIFWECETNRDCNEGDISTKDMCIEHKCSHNTITDCIDDDLYCPEGCNADTDNDCTDKCGSEIIDCGATVISQETVDEDKPNFDCFIDAARDCCPVKIVTETELNLFGADTYSKTYREIKGLQEERCVLYQRTDDLYYSYPEETRQYLLDTGMTEEEIDQALVELNEVAQDMIGKDSTCKYPIEELVDILEGEKEGSFSFSTEDAEKYHRLPSL